MMTNLKKMALAGAFAVLAGPAFAQGVPVIGGMPIIGDLPIIGDRAAAVDLDPTHLFMPAMAQPAAAPAPAPMMHHHRMMMHHKKMMMHHKKMMMHHETMKK